MLTEFGGIAYARGAGGRGAWGYSVAADADDFLRRYSGLMKVATHAALFSGFCYTQFADTFQEANGLLTAERVPKVPLEEIRKLTSYSRTFIPGVV
jgi:hypothetical protein